MEQKYKNLDCRNYAPVDVAKGICHVRKEMVAADGEACERFEKMPKCKHCANYTPREEKLLGDCEAPEDPHMTYPDLIATTCEWFSWKK
ncbi:4-hydroxyphenylacetate decarboxylase small subunit [bacterium]|nr:4-hydroxyphenylacetate decarboxylase small subunit [bacterium]